jgi:ferredoxin-NADP reductase
MPVAQKLLCRVERVVDHGDRVYTVALRPPQPAPRFRAGQFLHLALDPYDASRFWPESRVFSIASPPAQRELLRIAYSVRGRFTSRMESELVEGRDVWIKMPYGEFVVDQDADAVLFAGGTGITAFTAFLEGLTAASGQSVVLAYGARSSRLFIYREMVERCAGTVSSLDVSYFVERDDATDPLAIGGSGILHTGPVSVDAVWPRLSRVHDANYYISGPPAMLQAIARDLRARGIAEGRIHIDAWE